MARHEACKPHQARPCTRWAMHVSTTSTSKDRTTRTPWYSMATGRRQVASVSSASGTMTALPAGINQCQPECTDNVRRQRAQTTCTDNVYRQRAQTTLPTGAPKHTDIRTHRHTDKGLTKGTHGLCAGACAMAWVQRSRMKKNAFATYSTCSNNNVLRLGEARRTEYS